MGEADVVALRESLLDQLMARFAWRLLDPELVMEADELVRQRFLELERAGDLPIRFAEGAVLTGYDVAIDHDRSSLGLSPRTDFLPSPRYPPIAPPCDERIALGFCGRFDLWVVKAEPRPPVIIARYGDGGDDYLSASPEMLGLAIVRRIGEPFPEALRRLVLLGLLDNDGASDPSDPYGASSNPATTATSGPARARFDWRAHLPWWLRRR